MPQGRYSSSDLSPASSGRYSSSDVRTEGVLRLDKPSEIGSPIEREMALRNATSLESTPEQRARLIRMIPTAAAMLTAPVTGAMSIPAAMAVTGGAAALGSGARSMLDDTPETLRQAATTAATEGVLQGGLQGVGRAISAAAPAVKSLGVRLWKTAAGSDSAKTAREILSAGKGALTRSNLAAIESPRSPSGAFIPNTFRPKVAETMRAGVERAGNMSTPIRELAAGGLGAMQYGPTGAVVGALAAGATRPLPLSMAAQGVFNLPIKTAGAATPQAIRAATLALLGHRDAPMAPEPSHTQAPSAQPLAPIAGTSRTDLVTYASDVNRKLSDGSLSPEERAYWEEQARRTHAALQDAK